MAQHNHKTVMDANTASQRVKETGTTSTKRILEKLKWRIVSRERDWDECNDQLSGRGEIGDGDRKPVAHVTRLKLPRLGSGSKLLSNHNSERR